MGQTLAYFKKKHYLCTENSGKKTKYKLTHINILKQI